MEQDLGDLVRRRMEMEMLSLMVWYVGEWRCYPHATITHLLYNICANATVIQVLTLTLQSIYTMFLGYLQRPLLDRLLISLHLIADLEPRPIFKAHPTFGSLAHFRDGFLHVLQG